MVYEIIKRLEQANEQDTLNYLASAVAGREKKKEQLHKVFFRPAGVSPISQEVSSPDGVCREWICA